VRRLEPTDAAFGRYAAKVAALVGLPHKTGEQRSQQQPTD
jgi:hypothetical protein